MHRLFVYGTLKKGLPNHGLLQDTQNGKAIFVTNGLTVEKYPLVVDPEFGIPFLLNSPGEGKNIEGEIWDVDDSMLKKLDGLEMHPDWYTRLQREVSTPESSQTKGVSTCWIYLLNDFNPKMSSYECISSYQGSSYVARGDRMSEFDPWSFKKS